MCAHVSKLWRSIRYTEVIYKIHDFQDLNMQPVHNACKYEETKILFTRIQTLWVL
jgi:hypothetical protein